MICFYSNKAKVNQGGNCQNRHRQPVRHQKGVSFKPNWRNVASKVFSFARYLPSVWIESLSLSYLRQRVVLLIVDTLDHWQNISMANCSCLLGKGVGNDYKQVLLIKDAYSINVHSLESSCRNGWVQYFCQSKHKRTDLKTARQHQWLWHRSWLDGCELVRFAPLGKRVLALMSCSADTNAKTLKLSKQEYCKVWGEAL